MGVDGQDPCNAAGPAPGPRPARSPPMNTTPTLDPQTARYVPAEQDRPGRGLLVVAAALAALFVLLVGLGAGILVARAGAAHDEVPTAKALTSKSSTALAST